MFLYIKIPNNQVYNIVATTFSISNQKKTFGHKVAKIRWQKLKSDLYLFISVQDYNLDSVNLLLSHIDNISDFLYVGSGRSQWFYKEYIQAAYWGFNAYADICFDNFTHAIKIKNKNKKELTTMNKVPIKKLRGSANLPTKGSANSAGYDLSANIEQQIAVQPHKTVLVPTGLSMIPPKNTFAAIFPRSGLSTKEGLRLANGVGVVDEDYRGEYMVAIHNDSEYTRIITPNQRIAQLVFIPYVTVDFEETDELTDTDRGSGGFGSTGKD